MGVQDMNLDILRNVGDPQQTWDAVNLWTLQDRLVYKLGPTWSRRNVENLDDDSVDDVYYPIVGALAQKLTYPPIVCRVLGLTVTTDSTLVSGDRFDVYAYLLKSDNTTTILNNPSVNPVVSVDGSVYNRKHGGVAWVSARTSAALAQVTDRVGLKIKKFSATSSNIHFSADIYVERYYDPE